MRRRVVGIALLLVFSWLAGPGSAHAATGERIDRYGITIRAQKSGRLTITEVIRYHFAKPRHGIIRTLGTRRRYDGHHDQIYRIFNVRALRNGTSVPVTETQDQDTAVVKIGRPATTVNGTQTYALRYAIAGALLRRNGRPEVYVNAIGTGWDVPISNVTVRIPRGSHPVCYAGDPGASQACRSARTERGGVVYREDSLAPHQGLTVVARLPIGQQVDGPILVARDDFGYRMARDSWVWIVAAVVVGLSLSMVAYLVWRYGRDRRYAGRNSGPSRAVGRNSGEEFSPVLSHADSGMEFVPPQGMRPGLAGVLVRQSGDMRDATATIVDLAVRGYLRIQEVEPEQWTLVKLREPDDELEDYELNLLRRFFSDDVVELKLPEMGREFAAGVGVLQDQLVDEAVRRQWYARRPDEVRRRWRRIGAVVLAAGIVLSFVLAGALDVGLLGSRSS